MRIVAFVFSMLPLFAGPAISAIRFDLDWTRQFDQAVKRARETGRPLLIEFWASWCDPCKRMDRESWPDARVVELSRKYVCVSVDIDRDTRTASRFLINGVPTIVLADPWAEPMIRHEGYLHARDLAGIMEQLPADFSEAREAREILAHDRKNAAALARMGRFFSNAQAPQLAIQYYGDALKTKEYKSDVALRCQLSLAIALDYVAAQNWDQARRSLERFLKDFPESPLQDQALCGLLIANMKQGNRAEGEKLLSDLKRKFPLSHATEIASRVLADAK